MELHNPLIKGTFILTVTGLLTRFMGFFYRIFLSHTFGAVQVGLYQLIFPIYALGYSATCAGIQTILSRSVASRLVQGRKKEARQLLYTGLLITLSVLVVLQFFCKNSRHFGLFYYGPEDVNIFPRSCFLTPLLSVLHIVLPEATALPKTPKFLHPLNY